MAIASYQSADDHFRGSVFSGEDLALIKSGRWLPELSHFVPIDSPHDIDENLDHARDDGEKIDLLLITALNPHVDTLRCLGEFIQSKDLTILAATLRAFASIGEMLKDSSIDEDYRHHLEHLRWVLTANLDLQDEDNPSVQLFKRLCQEAESGSSDLIRWSAAYALQQLDYPAGLRRQLLHKPPAEIGEDIVPNYLSRLSAPNNARAESIERDNPSRDREYIKFWTYGTAEVLFQGGSGTYYLDVVREVLSKLGMRGIRLSLQWGNRDCKLEAIDYAGEIFGNSRYKAEATRQSLANRLLPFLDSTDIELRNLVAEKLNDGDNNYEVSNKLLAENDRIKVAIIDTPITKRWERVVALGEITLSTLSDAIEGRLRFLTDGNQNTERQIKAVEAVDKILVEPSRKANYLSLYLQHDDNKLRMRVANLLKPIQSYLDTASKDILGALLFTLDLPYESSNIGILDKKTIEACLAPLENHKQNIQNVFSKAISACRNISIGSIATRNFLSEQQISLIGRIQTYQRNLSNRILDINRQKELEDAELIRQKKLEDAELIRQKESIEYRLKYAFADSKQASPVKRLAAYLLDLIIIQSPMVILFMSLREIQFLNVILLIYTWYFLYLIIGETSSRQASYGKQIVGLVVANVKGERLSFVKSFFRIFVRLLCDICYVNFIVVLFHPENLTLQDIFTGTRVYETSKQKRQELVRLKEQLLIVKGKIQMDRTS